MTDTTTEVAKSHALELLAQLREAFVAELPERCDDTESLVLRLEQLGARTETFDELYRRVHSLKGSAGTHGIPVLSTICHYWEDQLNVVADHLGRVDGEFIDLCLRHVDLLRTAVALLGNDNPDFSGVTNQLEALRQTRLQHKRPVLLVESSPFMMNVCLGALAQLPIQLSTETDGLSALNRLLGERFDILITGRALNRLSGTALTCALRASECANRAIKVVMLTSDRRMDLPPGYQPDCIVHRSSTLQSDLTSAVSQLLVANRD